MHARRIAFLAVGVGLALALSCRHDSPEGGADGGVDAGLDAAVACVPSCGNKKCGPDGCGGVCGTCGGGYVCESASSTCIPCSPRCSGKSCGGDGCGGSCGSCQQGMVCNANGACETCTRKCTGRSCGTDGCGGTCGSCAANQDCTPQGTCVTTSAPDAGSTGQGHTCAEACKNAETLCNLADAGMGDASYIDICISQCTTNADGCTNAQQQIDCVATGTSCNALASCPPCSHSVVGDGGTASCSAACQNAVALCRLSPSDEANCEASCSQNADMCINQQEQIDCVAAAQSCNDVARCPACVK